MPKKASKGFAVCTRLCQAPKPFIFSEHWLWGSNLKKLRGLANTCRLQGTHAGVFSRAEHRGPAAIFVWIKKCLASPVVFRAWACFNGTCSCRFCMYCPFHLGNHEIPNENLVLWDSQQSTSLRQNQFGAASGDVTNLLSSRKSRIQLGGLRETPRVAWCVVVKKLGFYEKWQVFSNLQPYLRSNDMFFQFHTHWFMQVLSVMSFVTFCN